MPQAHWSDEEFKAAAQRLDQLVQEFENLPLPEISAKALELLQAVDTIHREGLGRLIMFLHEQGHADLVLRAAHDPVVSTLLLLYDFIPSDDREPAGFVPLDDLLAPLPSNGSAIAQQAAGPPQAQTAHTIRRPVFQTIAQAEDIPRGTMKELEVAGVPVLVVNVDDEWYAVRNACPVSAAPLHQGVLSPPVVVCPWHNEAYDIRTGARADGHAGPGLAVLPIALVDGALRLAVDTLPAGGETGGR